MRLREFFHLDSGPGLLKRCNVDKDICCKNTGVSQFTYFSQPVSLYTLLMSPLLFGGSGVEYVILIHFFSFEHNDALKLVLFISSYF